MTNATDHGRGRAWGVVSCALLCAGLVARACAGPSIYPTGTTRYDPAKAFNSYVLFTGADNIAHLIDLDGNTVHEWKDAGSLSTLLDPAVTDGQLGHVLVTLESVQSTGTALVPGQVTGRVSKLIGEVDWHGATVWQFGDKAPEGLARQHHDWARLPGGNTIVLANWIHPVAGFKQPRVLDDVIYEVNRTGEIVWRWIASEHLQEFGFTPGQLQKVRAADTADYLHVNDLKVLGPNHWYDEGDKRFAPDNLLLDSRNANFIVIIDKVSGTVVWNLGPNYTASASELTRNVPRPVDRTSGQHDAQIIPKGLPGAGNLLVFDNEGEGGYPPAPLPVTGGSRVLEIDPVHKQIVWQYTGEDSGGPGWSFKSTHISNARRLPNGNTFIDEGQSGRLFQVTRDGEIVWEYVSPYFRRTTDPITSRPTLTNQVYRGQPVPYGWVPAGTPHAEHPVRAPDPGAFRVPD